MLVSCIMPTHNRRRFVGQAIRYFLRQDYPSRELIIVDDGEDSIADLVPQDERIRYMRLEKQLSLGAKRNLACELSKGELIAHWDDDDWMASNRLRLQVSELLDHRADVCGVCDLLHYHLETGQAWRYRSLDDGQPWLAGCTLLYRRSTWAAHPFADHTFGGDLQFLLELESRQIHTMSDSSFYVALIHAENTFARNLADHRWERCSFGLVSTLLARDQGFYVALRHGRAVHESPDPYYQLVSCIMPTYNRRLFVPQAIRYFLQQNYPNRELVIVDDGTDPVNDLIPDDSRIRYVRLSKRHSVGAKRNLACEVAGGEVLAFWDDDDWYAYNRLLCQVAPLLDGRADATGLGNSLLFCLPTRQFWACTPELHMRMFYRGVISGTLAFWKNLWEQGIRFPDTFLAEDAAFVKELLRHRARLEKVDHSEAFVYVRHQTNTWQFAEGSFLDVAGWRPIEPPSFIPSQDLGFYGLREQQAQTGPRTIA